MDSPLAPAITLRSNSDAVLKKLDINSEERSPITQEESFQRLMAEGKRLFQKEGNYEGAIKKFKEAESLAITRLQQADVYFYLSLAYYAILEEGKSKDFEEVIRKLIKIDYYRELDKSLCPQKYMELFKQIKGEYGILKIQSEPPGADVYLNENKKSAGKTPLTIGVVAGPINIKIKKGRKEKEETITIFAGKETFSPVYNFKQPLKLRSSFLILGGINSLFVGDLNEGAQGFVDFFRDQYHITQEFNAKAIHLSYIYGGEFTLPIGSNFYLGFGADHFLREAGGLVVLQESPAVEIHTRPRIQALPIRLFISFYPVHSFYIKTGIEYYFARCEYFYRYLENTYWKDWYGEAKAQGSGILAAAGLDLRLTPGISFVLEGAGRFAKISGFEGTNRSIDSNAEEYIEEGRLYYYKAKGTADESFPFLFIRQKKPIEGVLIFDPRQAIIDFSGVSLKAGIRLKF